VETNQPPFFSIYNISVPNDSCCIISFLCWSGFGMFLLGKNPKKNTRDLPPTVPDKLPPLQIFLKIYWWYQLYQKNNVVLKCSFSDKSNRTETQANWPECQAEQHLGHWLHISTTETASNRQLTHNQQLQQPLTTLPFSALSLLLVNNGPVKSLAKGSSLRSLLRYSVQPGPIPEQQAGFSKD